MPLTQGQVLQNRYRITGLLGQGGMGAVYRAWDMNLNMSVAVKENMDASVEAQRQFSREAGILARLTHPHLARVTDYFFISGQGQYLVMDFVEGEDLQERVERLGPLPEAEVLPWIVQICNALSYLHRQPAPIIHRDIKPANIKIRPDGQAMLVDFGIAKIYDPNLSTTIGARAVTPGYSPPEQYGGGDTRDISDIYALGATLYTLLTGQLPPESVQRMVSGVTLPPPRRLNPQVSPRVEQAILRAMDIATDRRFQSAAELQAALGETGRSDKFTRSVPIRSSWWIGLGLVVLILLGVSGLVMWGRDSGVSTATPVAVLHVTTTLKVAVTPTPIPTRTPRDTLVLPTEMPVLLPTETPVLPTELPTATPTSMPTDTPYPTPTDTPIPLTPTPAGPPPITVANADKVKSLGTLNGHTKWVTDLAFSPDEAILASAGSWDNTVRLWRTTDWSLIRIIEHPDPVMSVAFNSDGSLLAVGFGKEGTGTGDYGSINLWQISNESLIQTLTGHGYPPYSLTFSPDGTLMVSASPDWTVLLWQVADWRILHTFNSESASKTAFSPDGTILAATSTQTQLWHLPDGAPLRTLASDTASIAFSPDGALLVAGTREGTIQVRHVINDNVSSYTLEGHTDWVQSLAFSPNGSILASGGDKTVRLWGMSNRALLHILEGHTDFVQSVVFSPNGTILASGGRDGVVRLWGIQGD